MLFTFACFTLAVGAGVAAASEPHGTHGRGALGPVAEVRNDDGRDRELARVVADYVGLYTRDTLPAWRKLFLTSFVAGSARPDGTALVRSLDEFYEAQRRYFETGKAIRETLENVRIERHGRLASVWADFVLEEEGERSRGRLVLTLIEAEGSFKIHSLLFSYGP
ncbi:MAG TPA: nuclear transport factor 2 family protein [Vicinamibacteria bacterium]